LDVLRHNSYDDLLRHSGDPSRLDRGVVLCDCLIISTVCGTSWGSVGTVGVALIGIAASLGAPLPITAGAIVAGAYFGDKMSPLSESTNLASLVCGSNLYEHIRHLCYTTMPVYVLSLVLYVVLGHTNSSGDYVRPANVQLTLDTLSTMYTFGSSSWILAIPALVVIVGSILKFPTIPTMLLSASIAFLIGITVQDFALKDGITAMVRGFNTTMTEHKFEHFVAANIAPYVTRLLTRGGMEDMMKTLLVVFCAFGFAGIVSKTGMLETLLKALTDRIVLKQGSVILSTIGTCILVGFTTGSSYLCLIIPSEMFRESYKKVGLHPVNLSRTVEDAGTVLVPLIPWSMAGIFMYSQLGVPVIDYAPYAFLCYGCFILAAIYGFTGIAIRQLHPEQSADTNSTQNKRAEGQAS
jgi:Na+:H+ antiporter, NhaC family